MAKEQDDALRALIRPHVEAIIQEQLAAIEKRLSDSVSTAVVSDLDARVRAALERVPLQAETRSMVRIATALNALAEQKGPASSDR